MKQKVLMIGVLALAIAGASLGYRTTMPANEHEAAEAVPNREPVAIDPVELPAPTRKNVPTVFDELKLAATRHDKVALKRLRDGWLMSCSRREFEDVIDLVSAERDKVWRGMMMESIAGRWATYDPQAAIDFMTNQVHRGGRQVGLTKIFEVLAAANPASAFAMISATSEAAGHPANMQPATEAVFAEWRKSDPAAAFAALETLSDQGQRWSALQALCSAENADERALVFENIRAVEDSDLQRDAWKQAIGSWSKQAPFDEVIDWIGEQTFEGNLASRLEREAAIQHGDDDPRKMADWLVERADDDSLPGHLAAAVRFWAKEQPNACGEWLHSIELGAHSDRAVETFAYTIMRHDTESAFVWAQSIEETEKRSSVMEDVSHHFYRYNPGGFLETVATSPLPEAEQRELVEKIQKAAEFR